MIGIYNNMMPHMGGSTGMTMGLGLFFQVIFFVILIGILIWILNSKKPLQKNDEDPEKILKRRYVNGEINKEEYESMLEEIKK